MNTSLVVPVVNVLFVNIFLVRRLHREMNVAIPTRIAPVTARIKKVVKTSILIMVELRTDPLGSLTSFSFDGVADSIIDGIEDENGYVDGTCDCKYI